MRRPFQVVRRLSVENLNPLEQEKQNDKAVHNGNQATNRSYNLLAHRVHCKFLR